MRFTLLFFIALISIAITSQDLPDDCLNHIDGLVINKKTGKLLSQVHIDLKRNGKVLEKAISDESGTFSFDIKCDGNYQIYAQLENHTESTKLIFPSDTEVNQRVEIALYPIKEFRKFRGSKKIVVASIEFIPDSYDLTSEALDNLEIVSELLRKYPQITIEIGFHSDVRGNATYLINLTQKRADICADYLIIDKGINSSRVLCKGYGASQLINHCKKGVKCSSAEHMENRRTEFVVIE